VVVPFERVDVEQHRPRGVADVGDVLPATRQVPDQPGVDGPEREFASFGARSRARDVIQDPANLRGGEVRIDDQSGLLLDRRAGAVALQTLTEFGGAAVLPY